MGCRLILVSHRLLMSSYGSSNLPSPVVKIYIILYIRAGVNFVIALGLNTFAPLKYEIH